MSNIKGIIVNSDSAELISKTDGGTIQGDLTINGDVKTSEKPKLKIVDFTNGSDEEIAAMLEAHYKGDINIEKYWNVGDTRKIHLNEIASPNKYEFKNTWTAQDITIVITALNHHPLKTKIGIRDKAAVTIQTREVLNNVTGDDFVEGTVYVNFDGGITTTFYPWSKLPLRTWLNESFLTTCFSNEWQNIIKETKHNRLTSYDVKTTEEVIDKIFLPSCPEIYGNTAYNYYLNNTTPAGEEGTQWEYYKTSSNKNKYGNNNGVSNNTGVSWWMGSASSSYNSSWSSYWCHVDFTSSTGKYVRNDTDKPLPIARDEFDRTCCLAPAWCI